MIEMEAQDQLAVMRRSRDGQPNDQQIRGFFSSVGKIIKVAAPIAGGVGGFVAGGPAGAVAGVAVGRAAGNAAGSALADKPRASSPVAPPGAGPPIRIKRPAADPPPTKKRLTSVQIAASEKAYKERADAKGLSLTDYAATGGGTNFSKRPDLAPQSAQAATSDEGLSTGAKVGIGVVLLGVLGGGAYALTRKKKR